MQLKPFALLLVGTCQSLVAQQRDRASRLAHELDVFADSFFTGALRRQEIPGAVLVVVKDGKVLLSRGYGFANLEKRVPVDPERTIFRVASVSKLFTATAVMQQVERRRLRLDADVNTYLKIFQIPTPYGRPVKVADLLTHSGGFDERQIGTVNDGSGVRTSLGTYLATHMPPPIRPPGEMVAYSNHGIALAGYLVEVVSGKPFEQYEQDEILLPLGMTRSSFDVVKVAETERATAYVRIGNQFKQVPFDNKAIQIPPAAGLITTGSDMGHFLIALLGDQAMPGRILSSETLALMQRRHLANDPALPGATYGSFEHFENGLRGIVNDGDWVGFANRVFLAPEEHFGVFVSVNTSDSRIRQRLIAGLLDVVHPDSTASLHRPLRNHVDPARFAGRYRSIAIPHGTIDKIIELIQLVVSVEPDSMLRLSGLQYNGSPSVRFYPIDSMVFAPTQGEGVLVFRADQKGRITHAFIGNTDAEITGSTVMERLPGYAGLRVQIALLAFLVICSLTILVWPLGAGWHRVRGRVAVQAREARNARSVAGTACILMLAFIIGFFTPIMRSVATNDYAIGDVPIAMRFLFVLPFATIVLGLAMPYFAGLAWRERYWSLSGRVHYSLLTLAVLLYIPFLIHWNLLGFNF